MLLWLHRRPIGRRLQPRCLLRRNRLLHGPLRSIHRRGWPALLPRLHPIRRLNPTEPTRIDHRPALRLHLPRHLPRGIAQPRQRPDKLLRRREPVVWILLQRLQHHVRHRLRYLRVAFRRVPRPVVQVRHLHRKLRSPGKRHIPRQQLVQRNPHGVDVRPSIHVLVQSLLRRHVVIRPDRHRRALQPATALDLGDPEVHHLHHAVVAQHQVCRLQVAMHNPLPMRRTHAIQRLLAQRQRRHRGQCPALAHHLLQRLAVHKLHHHHRLALPCQKAEKRGNVVVVQRRLRPRLRPEPRLQIRMVRQPGIHQLQRDHPLQVHIHCLVDDAHRAFSQLRQDPVVFDLLPDHSAAPRFKVHSIRLYGRARTQPHSVPTQSPPGSPARCSPGLQPARRPTPRGTLSGTRT